MNAGNLYIDMLELEAAGLVRRYTLPDGQEAWGITALGEEAARYATTWDNLKRLASDYDDEDDDIEGQDG